MAFQCQDVAEIELIVFDLREEAWFISYLYVVGSAALVLGLVALAPRSLQARLPGALADAARPMALTLFAITAFMIWAENNERRQAEASVEECLAGSCKVVEGFVSDVEPVHQITSTGRHTSAIYGGYFRVGDTFFAHYPRAFSNYSPANRLHNGDYVRVHSLGDALVIVTVIDSPSCRPPESQPAAACKDGCACSTAVGRGEANL